MTDDRQQLRDQSLIEREAVAWFTRMNGKPSRQEKSDFQRWLQASSDHRQAYDQLRGLWRDMGSNAHLSTPHEDPDLAAPLERIRRLRDERKTGKLGPVIVGCLALLVASCWLWLERPTLLQDMQADFVSPRGERRQITLADGSHVFSPVRYVNAREPHGCALITRPRETKKPGSTRPRRSRGLG